MIEKVFSAVVTLMIVLILGLVLYVSIFHHQAEAQQESRHAYEQQYGELLVNSLLLSHDNETELTYEALLSLSVKQIDTTLMVNGKSVDVKERFAQPLDTLLGRNNYYFTVAPLRKGVAVTYVLDGSASMADKRAAVRDGLPLLMQNLTALFGQDAVIYTQVLILGNDPTLCADFLQGERQTCTVVSAETMYNKLIAHGFLGPYVAPFKSYSEWEQSTHFAKGYYFGESDWASAAAYSSYLYQDDTQLRAVTNKHVIVAFADEMTSSSKADECFTLQDQNEYFFCNLCNSTCPVNRAQRIINTSKGILAENGDLFIGFYKVVCDYQYNTQVNNYYLTPYACKYLDNRNVCTGIKGSDYQPKSTDICIDRTTGQQISCQGYNWMQDNPGAGVNWCNQNACGACTPAPTGGTYCLHTNCEQYIINDLQELATETDGTALPLENLQDLTTVVSDYFSNQVENYDFAIGVRNESRDHYVIQRPITLADGTKVGINFWIYD